METISIIIPCYNEEEAIPVYYETMVRDVYKRQLLYPAFAELENIESAMQKSVEKQMQAERLKIDLITNVSHDLKTLRRNPVKQEQLKEMIQSLFELSKSTSGTEKFQMEKMDMKRLIEQTLADICLLYTSFRFRQPPS